MLKYSLLLRTLKDLIVDRALVRPQGDGPQAEAALDLIMETISVLDYDCDYLPGRTFEQITNDSRKVAANSIFFAINGARLNGRDFVPQALKQGAAVIVSEENLEDMLQEAAANSDAGEHISGTVNLVVKDSYKSYALACEAFYDFPTRKMNNFAITGTNGKTTSAMLIRHILQHAQQPCGMISTVEYDVGNGEALAAERTTPQPAELFALFDRMRKNSLRYSVMEVSSHALAQNRIGSMQFQAAIFTNLTGDHLDYHHTFDEYFRVKNLLFTEHLAPGAPAVINADDVYGEKLLQNLQGRNIVSFGRRQGDWKIENISSDVSGVRFTLRCGQLQQEFSSNLIGLHNIYNLAGVVLSLHCSNTVTLAESARILADTRINVPGRLETITLPNQAAAVVDYAHTHDALQNVLSCLRPLTAGRLICVFGAGGDRDKSKRPLMGKAAAQYADVIFLTSDNPRSEDPHHIITDIKSGIPADHPALYVEPNRKQAIYTAIKMSAAGDMILIAGKGHENYQEISGVKYPFDDREILRNYPF